jgi:hypothetical protein
MPHFKDVKTFRKETRPATIRKEARDGTSWTPTEQRKRDKLMKQFSKYGRKGYEVSSGTSKAYRDNFDLIDWSKE